MQISTLAPFGAIVAGMESSRINQQLIVISVALVLLLSATSLIADTYRWKDKDGNVHYGSVVPAEYAEQPYDVLNSAGIVIEHIEDTSVPLEERAEEAVTELAPLISMEERQYQTDRLLVIQYQSEADIDKALQLEIKQLSYDARINQQSFDSASKAIRQLISRAADQQRAGIKIRPEQEKDLRKLHARLASDRRKLANIQAREDKIRARFDVKLERYRFLTNKDDEPLGQG